MGCAVIYCKILPPTSAGHVVIHCKNFGAGSGRGGVCRTGGAVIYCNVSSRDSGAGAVGYRTGPVGEWQVSGPWLRPSGIALQSSTASLDSLRGPSPYRH